MTCSHSPHWLLANGVRDLNGFNPAIFTDRHSTMTVVIHVKPESIGERRVPDGYFSTLLK